MRTPASMGGGLVEGMNAACHYRSKKQKPPELIIQIG
jgi:hypothetical protein